MTTDRYRKYILDSISILRDFEPAFAQVATKAGEAREDILDAKHNREEETFAPTPSTSIFWLADELAQIRQTAVRHQEMISALQPGGGRFDTIQSHLDAITDDDSARTAFAKCAALVGGIGETTRVCAYDASEVDALLDGSASQNLIRMRLTLVALALRSVQDRLKLALESIEAIKGEDFL